MARARAEVRGCRGWVGLRRDSLHWACLPCPSHPCLALPCQALPPGPVPGAGSALVAAFSPLSLLLPELQMGAAWWEAQPGCSRLWPGLLPPPFPRGSLPSPPLPCPALPSVQERCLQQQAVARSRPLRLQEAASQPVKWGCMLFPVLPKPGSGFAYVVVQPHHMRM